MTMMTRMWLAGSAAVLGVGLTLLSAGAGSAATPAPAPAGPGIAPLVGVITPSWSVSATLHPSGTVKGTKTTPPPTPN